MKELVIMKINEYIDLYLFPPKLDWPTYWFNDRSDAIWAAKELIQRIRDSDESPYTVIENFILLTDEYANVNPGSRSSRMFEVASNIAADILNVFEMEGELHEIR